MNPFTFLGDVPYSQIMWILWGFAILLSLTTIFLLLQPLLRIARLNRKQKQSSSPVSPPSTDETRQLKASVIVYGISYEEEVIKFLETINSQDYPHYEIILVMNASGEDAALISEQCKDRFPRTYVTFIPPGSHNLSRRKLANTIGMKAATGDICITTVSNAEIPTASWLSSIMFPFNSNPDIDVVLGFSHIDYSKSHNIRKWYREFDDLLDNAMWVGYALMNKPYRGDGNNLAFKRELFFTHKGYSKSIYLHSGDDDLFITEISNGGNTQMVLYQQTILKTNWGAYTDRVWSEIKEQYHFTSRWLKKGPFIRKNVTQLMQWTISILFIVVILLNLHLISYCVGLNNISELIPGIVALCSLVCFWVGETIIYRKAAQNMGCTRLWWAIPAFWLWKPLGDMIFIMKHRRQGRKNFTWQRNK